MTIDKLEMTIDKLEMTTEKLEMTTENTMKKNIDRREFFKTAGSAALVWAVWVP